MVLPITETSKLQTLAPLLHVPSRKLRMCAHLFFSLIALILLSSGCSTARTESVTAFRTFDTPNPQHAQRLVTEMKTAMSAVANNVTATTGIPPDDLPGKPGTFEVSLQHMALPFGMSMSWPKVECKQSYSIITNTGGFSAGGASENDSYTSCIYPYQQGVRVHAVLVSTTSHGGGLLQWIHSSIKKLFVGSNEDAAERHLDQITSVFLHHVPEARLIKQSKEGEVGGILPNQSLEAKSLTMSSPPRMDGKQAIPPLTPTQNDDMPQVEISPSPGRKLLHTPATSNTSSLDTPSGTPSSQPLQNTSTERAKPQTIFAVHKTCYVPTKDWANLRATPDKTGALIGKVTGTLIGTGKTRGDYFEVQGTHTITGWVSKTVVTSTPCQIQSK